MSDIVGPANAVGAVTVRPSETRSFGDLDTWFQDCTSSIANDGTDVQAAWLNAVLGLFRTLIRGNGNAGGGSSIVAENNSDAMALLAIQHLLQRGQPCYGVAGGTANALVAALSPPAAEYKAGMEVRILVTNPNTTAVTLNLNGLGGKPVVANGRALRPGDLRPGTIVPLIYDGASFQWNSVGINMPPVYTTYYVNAATGSDTLYDGSSPTVSGLAGPFASIQRALDVIAGFNLTGYTVTVNVAAGVYGPVRCPTVNGAGGIVVVGNPAAPADVVIAAATGTALNLAPRYTFDGFRVQSAAPNLGAIDPGFGVWLDGGGTAVIGNIDFGVCQGGHLTCRHSAELSLFGNIVISGGCTPNAYGNAWSIQAYTNASVSLVAGSVVTLSITNPVSVTGFVNAVYNAVASLPFNSISNAGNLTGQKYSVTLNSVIVSNGGSVNFFPGTGAGVSATGGQYV